MTCNENENNNVNLKHSVLNRSTSRFGYALIASGADGHTTTVSGHITTEIHF